MDGDRFSALKQRIKERVDIVDLVESYLPLKARGRNLIGLCPFHDEKTPSFTVSPDSQFFKCFGCGKGGDVFTFVMERDRLTFLEAMERLGGKAGISVDAIHEARGRGRGEPERSPRAPVYAAMQVAAEFYATALQGPEGAEARAYLERRHLTPAIEAFGLGYAPNSSQALLNNLRARRVDPRHLVEGGVLVAREGGTFFDRFHGRVIFPIHDEVERVVAFGGRILVSNTELAKYINSPETGIFNKRKMLFGMSRARRAGHRRLLILEGYTAVIATHLAGITSAVATLGTALTPDHARSLCRVSPDGVTLLFDGDRAGLAAAERGLAALASAELAVDVAIMKGEKDPADLVLSSGRAGLDAVLAGTRPALTVKIELVRARHDVATDVGLARATEECLELVSHSPNPVRRDAMLQQLARAFHVSDESLRRKLVDYLERRQAQAARAGTSAAADPGSTDRGRASATARAAGALGPGAEGPAGRSSAALGAAEGDPGSSGRSATREAAEAELLACVLRTPSLLSTVPPDLVLSPMARAVLDAIQAQAEQHALPEHARVSGLFALASEDSSLAASLAGIVSLMDRIPSPAESLRQILRYLVKDADEQILRALKGRLRQAQDRGDESLATQLKREIFTQIRKTRQIKTP